MKQICQWCGLEFDAKNSQQKICNREHYATCKICGKTFPVSRSSIINKSVKQTCSKECCNKLKQQTNLERYGATWIQKTDEFKSKIKRTNLEKYGVENVFQSTSIQEKMKNTMIQRYGVENALQNPDLLAKSRRTCKEHYGVENCMSNNDIQQKAQDTMMKKYGVRFPIQSSEIMNKIQQTNLKKYGVKNVFENSDIQDKARHTMLERYGASTTLQSKELTSKVQDTMQKKYGSSYALRVDSFKQKLVDTCKQRYGVNHPSSIRMTDFSKYDEWTKFKSDPIFYIQTHWVNDKPTRIELSDQLGVDLTSIDKIIHSYSLEYLIKYPKSHMEEDIIQTLLGFKSDLQIVRNTKSIISPMELDVYLPEYNLAIECNPTYTHNSSFSTCWNNNPTDKNYHKIKSELCKNKGIFLFHIFGYEWSYKKDIIKSMLRNLIHCNQFKVYARNCHIERISYQTCKTFLDQNHRQGNTNAPIRYGLFYNQDLVSVMCFGKLRSTVGHTNNLQSDCYELVRFCSKLNISVIGGASKLFKQFLIDFNPSEIRSFSDVAHTSGNIYYILGFKPSHITTPNYTWVNINTNKAYNRMNTQKSKLKHFLNDDSIDVTMQTEKQIMESHNFVQVYDSGTQLWIYSNDCQSGGGKL